MKKVLSVVLLISMLLGMWIMPAAAVEGDGAAGAGEVLYYVDGQSRASWIGSFCNNQFTVAEDGSYFTTNAFLPAPFGQQVSISEVVQLSISLRVTDTTRSSGDYIALWHNAVDDSVQFRYYPMQNILALYIGDAIVGEPYEVNDWATGSEAVFHVLTMDMAEDGTVNCYADGEQVFETTLSNPVWTEKMPIVWNQAQSRLISRISRLQPRAMIWRTCLHMRLRGTVIRHTMWMQILRNGSLIVLQPVIQNW